MAATETRRFTRQGSATTVEANDITPDTPFWIGSNTKSMTALAVMQLVEAGLVELDAPVQQHLSDTPNQHDFATANPNHPRYPPLRKSTIPSRSHRASTN